ncbi:VOC family protein [Halobacillus naozhouensis]|uniref:VOC family protein n=1 Tax=Halobacillus naozhouensis TaxID=554880 RepID=A0ABY8J1H5_9BACI|nr:VOC family protein [Halobacillus naozhouensis]WFT76349.1 VOC family protein [Halobacillus naozhouensis]
MVQPLMKGLEGAFIPVRDPARSAVWYEEILGCTPLYVEKEAVTMKLAEESQTVICLVRTPDHKPMEFPENHFGVTKYYNFLPEDIEETHRLLCERGVRVNPIGGEGSMRYFTFFDPDGNPLGCCN